MGFELPQEWDDKTDDEIFKELAGKRVLGRFIRRNDKVVVAKKLDTEGRVRLLITKRDGSDNTATVRLFEIRDWLEACEFKEAVDNG